MCYLFSRAKRKLNQTWMQSRRVQVLFTCASSVPCQCCRLPLLLTLASKILCSRTRRSRCTAGHAHASHLSPLRTILVSVEINGHNWTDVLDAAFLFFFYWYCFSSQNGRIVLFFFLHVHGLMTHVYSTCV